MAEIEGVLLIDKPAGITSHDVVAAVRRSLGGVQAPGTPARSTRSPRAADRARRPGDQGAAPLMALPKRYETVARLGATLEHRRSRGRDHRDRAPPARPAAAADRRDPPAPAGVLGDEGRRRAGLPARPPRRASWRCPSGSSTVHRFEQLWRTGRRARTPRAAFAIECSLGHLRALADRRPGRRLLPGAAAHRDRAVRRRRRAWPAAARRAAGRSSAATSRSSRPCARGRRTLQPAARGPLGFRA